MHAPARLATAAAGLLALSPVARAQSVNVPTLPNLAAIESPFAVAGNRVEVSLASAYDPLAWVLPKATFGKLNLTAHKVGMVLPDEDAGTPSQLWLRAEANTTIGTTPLTLTAESWCGWDAACATTTSLSFTPATPSPLVQGLSGLLGKAFPLKQEKLGMQLNLADSLTLPKADPASFRASWSAELGGDAALGQPTLNLNASCGVNDCSGTFRLHIPLEGPQR